MAFAPLPLVEQAADANGVAGANSIAPESSPDDRPRFSKTSQKELSMAAATAEAPESNPLSVLGDALEAAAQSIGDARADASESAKAAAQKVKSGVSAGAYNAAYGLSFGVVFGAVFLKELLPEDNALRRGFEDGAEAAIDAVASRRAAKDQFEPEPEAHEPEPKPQAAPKPRVRKVVIKSRKAEG